MTSVKERLEKIKQGFIEEGYDYKTYGIIDINTLITELSGKGE